MAQDSPAGFFISGGGDSYRLNQPTWPTAVSKILIKESFPSPSLHRPPLLRHLLQQSSFHLLSNLGGEVIEPAAGRWRRLAPALRQESRAGILQRVLAGKITPGLLNSMRLSQNQIKNVQDSRGQWLKDLVSTRSTIESLHTLTHRHTHTRNRASSYTHTHTHTHTPAPVCVCVCSCVFN